MYIDKSLGKKPIEFKDIIKSKVFEWSGNFYMKGSFGDNPVAINLDTGDVINPQGKEMENCILYPAATLRVNGIGHANERK